MKAYLAILYVRMVTLFQYRGAAFAGVATQIFWAMIKTMILTAFYAQAPTSQPISLTQAITFIWLGQALLALLPWNIDKELETQIKNGNVSYELVRPINLYSLWYARAFAIRTVPTIMRCIPVFIIAILFFELSAPISWAAALAFAISLIFGSFLSTAITTLIIISLFWTISGEGIQRLMPHVALLLSGLIVPLPLYPEWLQPFLNLQPLRGVIDIPSRLYTGVIPAHEAFYYLGFQLIWILILVGIGRWLMGRALKQIVIQGG
ncbi:MAG TPA: ABC-2 family transporter protein [Parachlamydiaceae bacterium]|nr:ABC-2 family transporter protein [Parachlamydiaceae bacterium]